MNGPFQIREKWHKFTETQRAGWSMAPETHGITLVEQLVGMSETDAVVHMTALWGWYCPDAYRSDIIHFHHRDGKSFSCFIREDAEHGRVIDGTGDLKEYGIEVTLSECPRPTVKDLK